MQCFHAGIHNITLGKCPALKGVTVFQWPSDWKLSQFALEIRSGQSCQFFPLEYQRNRSGDSRIWMAANTFGIKLKKWQSSFFWEFGIMNGTSQSYKRSLLKNALWMSFSNPREKMQIEIIWRKSIVCHKRTRSVGIIGIGSTGEGF